MITLINPPSPFLMNQKAFPPLGLLYLASALELAKHKVNVLDLSSKENIIGTVLNKHYLKYQSDLYFITSSSPQYYYAKIIKDILKHINPKCEIIIGGSHPSSKSKQCVEDGFNLVIEGEGEKAVVDIVNRLIKYPYIKNINYTKINSEHNNRILKYPYITNIDNIPYPARHLIDIKSYGYDLGKNKVHNELATTLITSRGCPYECAFCSKDVWKGNKIRFHSPEYILGELQELINKYNFKNFLFLDDSFATNQKRILKILDLIEPLNIKYRCYINSKTMTEEILTKMYNSGCIEVGIGIESGSQQILNNINKKTNPIDNLKLIQLCKKIGITSNAFIVIGLPGETYETIETTKQWMEKALPDKFGFNMLLPYVGTPVYKNPDKYDITVYPMPDKDSWAKGKERQQRCYVSTKELSREQIEEKFNELFDYYTNLLKFKPGIGKT